MSPGWPCLLSLICLVLSGLGDDIQAGGAVQCKRPAGEGINPGGSAFHDKNSYIYMRCETGYRPSPSSSSSSSYLWIQCINPGTDDEWHPRPLCIAQCKKPGNTRQYEISGKKPYYDVGESVSVTCYYGYHRVYEKITCVTRESKNEWDYSPQCIALCQRPASRGIKPAEEEFYYKGDPLEVACETGYRLSSSSYMRITCINPRTLNEWDGYPQCIAQCLRPAGEGMIPAEKEFYDKNESINVTCDTGYRPSSPRIHCINPRTQNEWDHYPQCIEQNTEGQPEEPKGKHLTAKTSDQIPTKHNTEIQLEEPNGKQLTAKTSDQNPTAQEGCNKPMDTDLYTIQGSKDSYDVGENVSVDCRAVYRPVPSFITCVSPDRWDPSPGCVAQCKRPKNIEINSSYEYTASYDVGEVVSVQCWTGYDYVRYNITCVSLDRWDPSPGCVAQCMSPVDTDTYTIYGSKAFYDVGEHVPLQCWTGYGNVRYNITCVSPDRWDPSPGCVAQCKRPEDIQISHLHESKASYDVGEVVSVQCKAGYSYVHYYITCVSPDRWDPSPGCVAQCKKPVDTETYTIYGSKASYDVGEVVSVHCKAGYSYVRYNITCVSPDRWFPSPGCVAQCKRPESTDTYTIQGSKDFYNVGERVTVQCNAAYRPVPSYITCMRPDHWDYTPQCVAQCQRPAGKGMITEKKEFYDKGGSLSVTCETGYRLPSPSSSHMWIQCINPGTDNEWSPRPLCIEQCKKPSISNLKDIAQYKEYYNRGEGITLQCKSGYYPSSDRIQCKNNGSRDDWRPTAVCIEQCKKPSISNLKDITQYKEYYYLDEEVTLQCKSGYYPSYNTTQCKNNGGRSDWRPTAVCIEQCKKPSISNLKDITQYKEYYNLDEEVTLQCKSGYYPSYNTIQCKNNGGRSDWTPFAVCIEVKVENMEMTSTSICLRIMCTPDLCQNTRTSYISTCIYHKDDKIECNNRKDVTKNVTFSSLKPNTEYKILITNRYFKPRLPLQTIYITTNDTVPLAPEMVKTPNMEDGRIVWRMSDDRGRITGSELNIVAWRYYNSSFSLNVTERFPPNVTQYKINLQPGTNYTFSVRGFTSAGSGEYNVTTMETPIGDPPEPRAVTKDLSLHLLPVSDAHGPISDYEIIIFTDRGSNTSACLRAPHTPYNSSLTPIYTAALLPAHNLTEPITLGDGKQYGGFYNAPLTPNLEYTVYARVTSRWKEARKSSCKFLGVFRAADPVQIPVIAGSAAALLLVILVLVVIWRTKLYRKLHKTEEIQLKPGVGKKKDIPVENLLDAVKSFRYKEIFENEDEEEEIANILPAGRHLEYKELPNGLLYPCDTARAEENQSKNRYKKVLPYDDSRVVLRSNPSGSDYINASYIDGYKAPKFYIATQGPLPETLADFWSMVWQEGSSVIIMLTGLEEQSKVKCERYWPEQAQTFGDITVSLQKAVQTGAMITRSFSLKKAQSMVQMTVEQLHYLEWPDHGVPSRMSSFLQLLEQMNKCNTPGSGPVIVHCSAGIGRTGTFIALDILLKMARAVKKVNVFSCVRQLRQKRVNMVQNKEQYSFLYDTLVETLLCGTTSVPVLDIQRHLSHMTKRDPHTHMDSYDKEFQALEEITQLYQIYQCKEAKKPENKNKNRDSRILPSDHWRPILFSALTRQGAPAYINAVFVNSNCLEDVMIATQLPMKETLGDFWSLVWDYKCTSVVMMHRAQDLAQMGPHFYPHKGESHYGGFIVTVTGKKSGSGYRSTSLIVRRENEMSDSRLEVTLWQLISWPLDQHLPQDPSSLITVIGEAEKCQQQMKDSHILVTCSDGASRSGLFGAGLILCDQIRSDGVLDVSQAARSLRRRRCQFIPSKEMYAFCYVLAQSYLESFETYGNFK